MAPLSRRLRVLRSQSATLRQGSLLSSSWTFYMPLTGMATKTSGTDRPKLVVFDLDYTLWPFRIDIHVNPPFTKGRDGRVFDLHGRKVECYPEVPKVLQKLKADGYTIAVASRARIRADANSLITLFDWDKYITYREIHPGTKTVHFTKIFKASGIKFREMIFFDDMSRNISDLTQLGVLSFLVKDEGVTEALVNRGLKLFAEQRQKS